MRLAALITVCVLAVGCQQRYYKISDISTNKAFYTHGWLSGMYRRQGSIRFTEIGTGDQIALQSSRAHEVSSEEALRSQQGATGTKE